MELFAAKGEGNTTLREVARAAGVTHRLVVHHFGSKDGLRRAVLDHLLELLRSGIARVEVAGTAREIGRARDAAVDATFAAHPAFVRYLRQALLDPDGDGELVHLLTDNTVAGIHDFQAAGQLPATVDERRMAYAVVLREIGPRILVPRMEQVGATSAAAPAATSDRHRPSRSASPQPSDPPTTSHIPDPGRQSPQHGQPHPPTRAAGSRDPGPANPASRVDVGGCRGGVA